MRFFDSAQLNWLVLLICMLVVQIYFRKKSLVRIKKSFGSRLGPFLTSSFSDRKFILKFFLELTIVALLVCTLARPQFGVSTQKQLSEGLEIVLIADVSPSMLAEDMKPSRLENMKTALRQFVRMGSGDKVGLIALSGGAMLLSPLTTDVAALEMYIDSLTVDTVSSHGTDFKSGFDEALLAFKRSGSGDESQSGEVASSASRVVLLASDGENHEGGAKASVEKLQRDGAHVFTLTFGTEDGAPIPIRDEKKQLAEFKKDKVGQVVLSRSQPNLMKELSTIGAGGSYFADYGGEGLKSLRADLDRLQKGEFDSRNTTVYDEKYQIPLLLAIALSLVELGLGTRKPKEKVWKGRFELAS